MRLKGNAYIDEWKFKKQKLFCLDKDGTIKSPSNSCSYRDRKLVRNPRLRVCENGCQSTCSVPHLDLDGNISYNAILDRDNNGADLIRHAGLYRAYNGI